MDEPALRDHTRMLARTALLALVCALMYVAGRLLPGPFRWIKYFCPATTAILDGDLDYRLRHAVVSSLLIGVLFQAGEAVAYFLLIGSFGLFFGWQGPFRSRIANSVAFLAFFSLTFSAWIAIVPGLLGLTFTQTVALLMPLAIPDAVLTGPAVVAVAFLALSFFTMMYLCNTLALAWMRRARPWKRVSKPAGGR